jgi:putative DNA primase/helicase
MNSAEKENYIERLMRNAPEELIALPVWLVWKSLPPKEPGKKPRKVPYYSNGKPRGVGLELDGPEDRTQLGTFDEAIEEYRRGRYEGLGVALGGVGDQVLSGIDLDNIEPADPRAAQVMAAANSYAEVSPSGTGLKIFGFGNIGTLKEDKRHLEIYSGGRFFAVTGQAL